METDAKSKVIGDDGAFHAVDEVIDLSQTPMEGWASLLLFWALGAVVFTQFFTRYFLNDSASWTEEIARYLLIGVVFVGAAVGVAKNNHVHVDILYRYMPRALSRVLSTSVDLFRLVFCIAMVVLTIQMMMKMGNYQMTIIDLPMNIVYGVCLLGFAFMAVRSAWVTVVHWRRGYSVLERPDTTMSDR